MKKWGERRGSNPRIMESQSIALPLGDARHFYYLYYTINIRNSLEHFKKFYFFCDFVKYY